MLSQPQTTPASSPQIPPAISTIPTAQPQMPITGPTGVTGAVQATGATGTTQTNPTLNPDPLAGARAAFVNSPATPGVEQTGNMSVVLVWYAASVIAYALAFKKAAADIQNSPDGNGLFILKQAGPEKERLNPSTLNKDRANQVAFRKGAIESIEAIADSEKITNELEGTPEKSTEQLAAEQEDLKNKLGLFDED